MGKESTEYEQFEYYEKMARERKAAEIAAEKANPTKRPKIVYQRPFQFRTETDQLQEYKQE